MKAITGWMKRFYERIFLRPYEQRELTPMGIRNGFIDGVLEVALFYVLVLSFMLGDWIMLAPLAILFHFMRCRFKSFCRVLHSRLNRDITVTLDFDENENL